LWTILIGQLIIQRIARLKPSVRPPQPEKRSIATGFFIWGIRIGKKKESGSLTAISELA
jgi:hypothetical protein